MIYQNARIIRTVGGVYTVEASDGVYEAKPRGVFRRNGLKPCVGDLVALCVEKNAEPLITAVNERKNELVRPPLANLDLILLVISACEPLPNAYVIDKLLSIFYSKGIETALVFTKTDLEKYEEFARIYTEIGYRVFIVNNADGSGIDELRDYAGGKFTALIGNSGVGKSSLLNNILTNSDIKTGEISKKLGRGRHTTREVSFYKLGDSTYIADTPGFSTVDVSKYCTIPSGEVKNGFSEFTEPAEKCRFSDCFHLKETDCRVTEAVKDGRIAKSRYESYCRIYDEAKKKENEY